MSLEIDEVLFLILVIFVVYLVYPTIPTLRAPRPKRVRPSPPARLRPWLDWRADQAEHKRRLALITKNPFAQGSLPDELLLKILMFAVEWSAPTYTSLLLASRRMNGLALDAGLPSIRLLTPNQISSFTNLIRGKPRLVIHVRRLWIAPLMEERDTSACCDILRKCTRVEHLVLTARLAQTYVVQCRKFEHPHCNHLTLLGGLGDVLATPAVWPLLGQLTHLRVVGDFTMPPRALEFTNLAYLSFDSRPHGRDQATARAQEVFRESGAFPSLRNIFLIRTPNRRRVPEEPWPVADPFFQEPKVVALYMLAEWKEMQGWCNGDDLWALGGMALKRYYILSQSARGRREHGM